MTRVALLKCEDYDFILIREKMVEAMNFIGLEPGIFAGKRVVVKPNLLSASAPEKSVVAHPGVFPGSAAHGAGPWRHANPLRVPGLSTPW
jgi:uncharacterized protein (DUF362 family)